MNSGLSTVWLALPITTLALATPSRASAADNLPELLKEVHGHVENLKDAHSNYQQCIARGADPELCASLAAYCAIPGSGLVDSRAGLFSKLDLFQSFKVDCGDGECYQCCFTGEGCHTSFVGFPVINCNKNGYGPETRDAGITLITDPNAQPGDSCLTTPQTCDHLSLCLGDPNALGDLRDELENGLEHPLTMAGAADQRLRYFGKDFYNRWLTYLNRFHTGIPVEPDPDFASFGKLVDIDHFLTARGCVGWRDHVAAVSPYDWSGEHFAVLDAEGVLSEPASQLNGIAQLGLMRILDALPNVAARHAAVESTVWPDADRDAYLGQLADEPDAVLLESASPIALDLLRLNTKVSDYRLLAVPLADEQGVGERFNGCTLGAAPRLTAAEGASAGSTGALTVELDDPELGTEHEGDRLALLIWGDGTASRETIPAGVTEASFEHEYTTPGRYAVHAVVENTSGLRGFASATVETSAAAADTSAPHVFTEARFVDAIAYVDVLSGNERKLYFELFGRDADTGEELMLGVGQERSIPFNVDAPLGTLVGHNPGLRTIDQLTLRPAWRDGFYGLGWGGHYLTIDQLELHAPATGTDAATVVPVPLTVDNVRVYAQGEDAPVDVEYLSTTEDGRTLIWLHSSFVADRVEIDIPEGLLEDAAPGPLPEGVTPEFEPHVELRPGTFVPVSQIPEGETDGATGTETGATAGTGDTVGSDAGTETSGDASGDGGEGGCGCATGGASAGLWALLPLLWRRRRRT